MSTTTDTLEILARSRMFGGLSRRQLRTIARYSRQVSVESGRTLVTEGEPGSEFCIVVRGSCRIEQGGRLVRTLEPGESFGEMSMIDGKPRTASVITTEESELLVLSQPDFEHALRVAPDLGRALLRQLCQRVRQAEGDGVD